MTSHQQSIAKRQLFQLAASVVDSLAAVVTALEASTLNNSHARVRKPIPPELKTLLAKTGLTARAEKGALTVAEIDKSLEAAGIRGREAMTAKLNLMHSGLLPVGGK